MTTLPPGWIEVTDPSSGRPYYANASTNESRWDPPPLPPTHAAPNAVSSSTTIQPHGDTMPAASSFSTVPYDSAPTSSHSEAHPFTVTSTTPTGSASHPNSATNSSTSHYGMPSSSAYSSSSIPMSTSTCGLSSNVVAPTVTTLPKSTTTTLLPQSTVANLIPKARSVFDTIACFPEEQVDIELLGITAGEIADLCYLQRSINDRSNQTNNGTEQYEHFQKHGNQKYNTSDGGTTDAYNHLNRSRDGGGGGGGSSYVQHNDDYEKEDYVHEAYEPIKPYSMPVLSKRCPIEAGRLDIRMYELKNKLSMLSGSTDNSNSNTNMSNQYHSHNIRSDQDKFHSGCR